MRLILLLLTCLISGCSTWNTRESKIIMPDGREYRVVNQNDGKLDFKMGDVTISVDNRGRPGLMEQVLSTTLIGATGVTGTVVKDATTK